MYICKNAMKMKELYVNITKTELWENILQIVKTQW